MEQHGVPNEDLNHIMIKADKRIYRVLTDEILVLESMGDYVKLSLRNNRQLITHTTLTGLLESLCGTSIMRIHKSYAIATDKFSHIEGNIIVIDKYRVPISQSYKTDLMMRLGIKER